MNRNEFQAQQQAAQQLLAQGRLVEAKTLLLALQKQLPGDAQNCLMLGMLHGELGELIEAESCFRSLLKQQSKNADVHFFLGKVLMNDGRLDDAAQSFRKALKFRSMFPQAHHDLGLLRQQQGRLDEAEKCFRQAIRQQPNYDMALCNLGVVLETRKKFDEAGSSFQAAIKCNPKQFQAHIGLGNVYRYKGDLEKALNCFREAIRFGPDSPHAHNNAGNILLLLGKVAEAESCFERALSCDPLFVDAGFNCARACLMLGKRDVALQRCQAALQQDPDNVAGQLLLGDIYVECGMLDAAISQFKIVLKQQSHSLEAWLALGNLGYRKNELGEAERNYRKALDLQPDNADVLFNLGVLLKACGRVVEGVEYMRSALEHAPCNAEMISGYLLALNYIEQDPQVLFTEHQRCCERLMTSLLATDESGGASRVSASSMPESPVPESKAPSSPLSSSFSGSESESESGSGSGKRLRIAYLSPDFRTHSVAYFIEALLANYDTSRFEVFCYANLPCPDDTTARFRAYVDHWRDVYELSDEALVNLIRQDEVDILVDLAGHTGHNRLPVFAAKPAPLQVSYLGYPATTGLATIDYRLTDNYADPEGALTDSLYIESLVRLPHGFLCYVPPVQAPKVAEVPSLSKGYVTFASFNNLSKVSEELVRVWAAVLNGVPNSRLLLKSRALADDIVRERYERLFGERGIGPGRLVFVSWCSSIEEHLEMYSQVDVALDTFPYNGTTTSCEALWMGVPIVTLAGRCHAGRVGMSLLAQLGMPAGVAGSEKEYVRLAIDLAHDVDGRSKMRSRLRDQMTESSLCNAVAFSRGVYDVFSGLWTECFTRK